MSGKAKHVGVVAVTAEGAALCYRTLCVEGAERMGNSLHPEVTVHNFPWGDYKVFADQDRWDEVGRLLLESGEKLRKVGAEFLICPDNTVHQGLDLVRSESPLPWLHIAEEIARVAGERGFGRLLVLGTRWLMEGPVYPRALGERGIESVIPNPEQRREIDRAIFEELVKGRFEDSARAYFRSVIEEFGKAGCDAVVLGCTEIPLLIEQKDSPLPILDSTRTLARAALREALA